MNETDKTELNQLIQQLRADQNKLENLATNLKNPELYLLSASSVAIEDSVRWINKALALNED